MLEIIQRYPKQVSQVTRTQKSRNRSIIKKLSVYRVGVI